jgi:hypothetical protein
MRGDRDRGANVDALGDLLPEILGDAVAPGVERNDLARHAPLRLRRDLGGRVGIGQVRPGHRVQRPGGDGERAIQRVGPAIGPDHIAVCRIGRRADHRATLACGRPIPSHGKAGGGRARLGMRGQANMCGPVGGHGWDAPDMPASPQKAKPRRDGRGRTALAVMQTCEQSGAANSCRQWANSLRFSGARS